MKNKNLILISLDTVRADVGYSDRFEKFTKIRKNGVSFLNTISSSPLTPVSHATVFSALQPYNHGIRHLFKEKIRDVPTLPKILKSEGYKTGAVVSCPGMNKWYQFYKGFDHYDDEIPPLPDGTDPLNTVDTKIRGQALKRADMVVDRALAWLDDVEDEPFFLFVHFFDAHWPYEAPGKFGGNNCYEEEVAFSVYYLDILLKKIKEYNFKNENTTIIFSDHGEDLAGLYDNDKGGEELGHPEEFGHGSLLYNQTQKVVLYLQDSKLPSNTDIDSQVRLVDITPTALDLLGINYDKENFDGESIVRYALGKNTSNGLLGYSETYYPEEQQEQNTFPGLSLDNKMAFTVENRYKIIHNLGSNKIEFYDLKDDPNELNDLNNAK